MIRKVVSTLVLLIALHVGAAQSRAQLLFVTNSGVDTGDIPNVTELNASGNPTVFVTTGIGIPIGLAFDSTGNLYVANRLGKAIRKFSRTGQDLGNFASTGLNFPAGLAFDSAGNLYVASYFDNTVRKFSPTGQDLGNFASTGLNSPWGLAFDSAGNLYVTNADNTVNTVRKFSPTGQDLGNFASTGLDLPTGLAFDSVGNLYVASDRAANIRRFSPTGVDLGDFVITPFINGAGGLAFDPTGNLYVAITANRAVDTIRKFSPTGQDLGNFATYPAVYGPMFLAFQPNQPPTAICHAVTVPAGPSCRANASIDNGSFDPDGDTIKLSQVPPGPYSLGNTTVKLTVTDSAGFSSSCSAVVTVVDETPPLIGSVAASPSVLWPPNHRLVPVSVAGSASDNCGAVSCKIISVSSNEPLDAEGDWVITGDLTLMLRAERLGTGTGRVYTITVQCTDGSGNSSTKTVTVTVPHDQR